MTLDERKVKARAIVERHALRGGPPVWPDWACWGLVADVCAAVGWDPGLEPPRTEWTAARKWTRQRGSLAAAFAAELGRGPFQRMPDGTALLPFDVCLVADPRQEGREVPGLVDNGYQVWGYHADGFGILQAHPVRVLRAG